MFNTWALKERALFAINGEVLFTKDVNFTLQAYKYSLCVIGKKNLVSKITGLGDKVEFIDVSSAPFDSDEKARVLKAFELNRVIAIESESLEVPSFRKCQVPAGFRNKVSEIYNANKELVRSHKVFLKKNKGETLEDYKALIFKPVQSRLFL